MDKQVILALGLGTLVGTTLMTIFSHSIGRLRNMQFTEPVLLNRMLFKFGVLEENQLKKNMTGWILHYLIGLLFLLVYNFIWAETRFDPTFQTAFFLGCISGVVGIFGWSILFRIKSVPANIRVGEYYAQLFVAHIIFALTATGTFTLLT